MKDYLIHFTLSHIEFRLPELTSIAECYGFPIRLPENEEDRNPKHGFLIVGLESEREVKLLAERCLSIKTIYELWAHGTSYEVLHTMNQTQSQKALWEPYKETPFRFTVTSTNHRIPETRAIDVMESFSYMAYTTINLKNPGVRLACLEEYDRQEHVLERYAGDGGFTHVYFGRKIIDGSARELIAKFNVKKRAYYGNTSMDAEMSLLMANQAKAAPGKLVYDPFAGTGSMLYTCAHWGALVFGSDIDGRQMRGKDPSTPGIHRSASQYGVRSRILDCCTFDITNHPWRCGEIFDAIVTDPPYGVRAGAKRIGSNGAERPLRTEAIVLRDGDAAHRKPTYLPPMRPYELSDLADDLVELALYLLKPGGRLVFFLPTVTDEYQDVDIPVYEGMKLVGNSLQDFGKWGRRLITMEKINTGLKSGPPSFADRVRKRVEKGEELESGGEHIPAHRNFRTKYFAGFEGNA